MKSRGWILLGLLATLGCVLNPPFPNSAPPLLNPRPSQSINAPEALLALDVPEYRGGHINESLARTKMHLPDDHYNPCADAIDYLIKTPDDVDKDLIRLAGSTGPLRVRYRAAFILAKRGNEAASPILSRMGASKDANERYLAWHLHSEAITDGKLPRPDNVREALELYASETDDEVREEIEGFFGAAKAKAAVGPLIERVRKNPGNALQAIWALGLLGDPEAVPVIIGDFAKGGNGHYHLEALGSLKTEEAVDFIIEHLDHYGAPEALYESGSKKALAALREHLQKLKKGRRGDRIAYAATRVAIIRLEEKDPGEALMRCAEEESEARSEALEALQQYDATKWHERILKIYRGDDDWSVSIKCIRLLEDSALPEVTEAMIDQVFGLGIQGRCPSWHTDYDLREPLNKRLGTSFRSMKELRAYLKDRRPGAKAGDE